MWLYCLFWWRKHKKPQRERKVEEKLKWSLLPTPSYNVPKFKHFKKRIQSKIHFHALRWFITRCWFYALSLQDVYSPLFPFLKAMFAPWLSLHSLSLSLMHKRLLSRLLDDCLLLLSFTNPFTCPRNFLSLILSKIVLCFHFL